MSAQWDSFVVLQSHVGSFCDLQRRNYKQRDVISSLPCGCDLSDFRMKVLVLFCIQKKEPNSFKKKQKTTVLFKDFGTACCNYSTGGHIKYRINIAYLFIVSIYFVPYEAT